MDNLVIAGKTYTSRLLVGTGKYKDFNETRTAVETSGAEIITVAIRRTNIGQNANEPNLLEVLPPSQYTLLPNTAGCYTVEDAVRTLRLARELLDGHSLVKLEVLGDPKTLYPNMVETLKAAEILIKEDFQDGLHFGRSDYCQTTGRHGLCRRNAAGFIDWFGDGHFESVESANHHRQCQNPGIGRCGCRHGIRCDHCDGVGLRWRTDEHSDCCSQRPGIDGIRDAQSR